VSAPDREFHLQVLGRFELLSSPDCAPIRLSSKKASALLAIVALSPNKSVSRDRLAALLWGNRPDNLARQSLRQTLVRLQRDLPGDNIFEATKDTVRLLPSRLSVDLLQLQALSTSGDIDELRRAQDLAKGEFLPEFNLREEGFQDWLEEKRREADTLSARTFEAYCRAADRTGDGDAAVSSVERLLRLDPLREDWHRLALQIYARYRGHNEAMALAAVLESSLKRELDVPPEPQTLALLETIRRAGTESSWTLSVPLDADVGRANSTLRTPSAHDIRPKYTERFGLAPYLLSAAALLLLISITSTLAYFYAVPPSSLMVADQRAPTQWHTPPALQAKTRSAGRIISLAVLPFVSYGEPGSSTALIADMMSDDLINSLARVPALRVISRQTTRAYRDKPTDVAKIAEELGVRYVLEGSVRWESDVTRVNVELIDPQTRQPVWSERIARAGQDRIQIHEEIINRLSRELQFESYEAVARKATSPTSVLELTYKGFAAIIASSNRGRPALDEAKAYFDSALRIMPDSGEARRGIAMYHILLVAHALTSDRTSHLAEAERILTRQIHGDPNESNAQYFMGLLHELREEWKEAIAAFQRAVEINPSYALAYAEIGHVLINEGRSDDAIDLIHYAMRLSPRDPHRSIWLRFVGEAELELGRYSEATAHLYEAVNLSPNNPPLLRALTAALTLSGKTDEARKYLGKLRAVAPHLTPDQLTRRPLRLQPKLAEGLKAVFALD
jgi:DNA-binding SARP family transcriptional activator/TolB-like protein